MPGASPARHPLRRTVTVLIGLLAGCATTPTSSAPENGPRRYVCPRVDAPPRIDGRLDDACWAVAPWSVDFVDIEGERRPLPRFRTRAKMCWDDAAFYVAAELEEPHVHATLTERDSVIYQDDDFEVFIDPDGDTHAYAELEINALGTEWDLLLLTPYRDMAPPRRPPIDGWDIAGLETAVHVDGTIDDPSDEDRGWSVEIAIPWPALAELAGCPVPPRRGDVWRVNFSRVEWQKEIVDGRYRKSTDPRTGKPFAEDNWVWSPHGIVDMHRPERWGLVLFAEGEIDWPADLDEELAARRALRALYHAQRDHARRTGAFTERLDQLAVDGPTDLGRYRWPPDLRVTATTWEAVLTRTDGATMHITSDGRIWITPAEQPR